MRELPLLCKTDVVNNVIAGRQTQARRPVNRLKSSFGQPGDLLYVRETWRETGSAQRDDHKIPPADSGVGLDQIIFAAEHPEDGPWRPNIHMPKRFARIWLKVNRVWVERVQDISDADAIAEGIEANSDDGVVYYGPLNEGHADPRVAFGWLWDSIYSAKGFGWDANPWAWACEFERVER